MVIVNYTNSYRALDQFVENHNDTHEEIAEKIKSGVLLTAKEIIRIYGAFLIKANSIMELSVNKLPALKTNNSQLAKLVKVSTRTIQRHIIKLQESGIITSKRFCGSNSGYELLINPEILLANRNKSPEELKKELEEAKLNCIEYQEDIKEGATNCPHTYTGNNSYNKNNLLIGVDNPTSSVQDSTEISNRRQRSSLSLTEILHRTGYKTGNILTGNTGEKVCNQNSQVDSSRKDTGEKVPAELPAKNWKHHPPQGARRASLEFYAEKLWNLAKTLLYQDTYLTEFQVEQAKKMLIDWYEPVADKFLPQVHQNYCERIILVKEFIARDPERHFVQLPYKYFDTGNPSGFTGTKAWYRKHQKRKEEVRKKLILHSQIRKFLNNDRKPTEKRRSPLTVYRECETRIGKLKDNALLQMFHAAVLKPEIIHQIR